jgi:hypothetical protein
MKRGYSLQMNSVNSASGQEITNFPLAVTFSPVISMYQQGSRMEAAKARMLGRDGSAN